MPPSTNFLLLKSQGEKTDGKLQLAWIHFPIFASSTKIVLSEKALILEDVKQIKKCADENEDYPTSSLMDEYIENYGKKLWMLKQMKQ